MMIGHLCIDIVIQNKIIIGLAVRMTRNDQEFV